MSWSRIAAGTLWAQPPEGNLTRWRTGWNSSCVTPEVGRFRPSCHHCTRLQVELPQWVTNRLNFRIGRDTLAVRLTIPPVGFVENFHLQVGAPCRAHQKKGSRERLPFAVIGLDGRFRNRPFHPYREDVQGLEARPPAPRSPGLRWSEAGSRWRLHSGERYSTPWSDR